jgi:DNA-binding FrmR family transcriptional regulator
MLQRKPSIHETHPAILRRLKRADGHLRSIIEMIETEQPCLKIAQQLLAVENAVAQAKKTLIHDHIDHCLKQSVTGGRARLVQEFKEITKFL